MFLPTSRRTEQNIVSSLIISVVTSVPTRRLLSAKT